MLLSNTRALSYLYMTAIFWSLTGPLGHLISLPAPAIIWWRMLICVCCLLPFVGRSALQLLRIAPRTFFTFIGVGAILGVHLVFFFISFKYNVSIASIAVTATSFFICFIDYFIFKKRLPFNAVVRSTLIIISFIFIYGTSGSSIQSSIIFGAIGALLNAIHISVNAQVMRRAREIPSFLVVFLQFSGITLLITLLLVTGSFYSNPTLHFTPITQWADFFYILILSLICTVLSYYFYFSAAKVTPAFTQGFIGNLEYLFSIGIGVIFFKEYEMLGLSFYVAIGVLILLIILQTRDGLQHRQKS